MKIFVINHGEGKLKGKWTWALESDNGRGIAAGNRAHDTKDACLNEIKAVQAGFPSTKILDRAAKAKSPAAK